MFNLVQTHHGISCSNLTATKSILRAIGFTETQPGAEEPLVFRNESEDYIGQVTAPVLGDEYHTHYVENPATGHQIDLIEIQPAALTPRPSDKPMQGDLVIGFPVSDPMETYSVMREADPDGSFSAPVEVPEEDGIRFVWRDGQHSILHRGAEPFAVLHYHPEDFSKVRRFYEYVLQVEVKAIKVNTDGTGRYRLSDIGGRMDIVVARDVHRLDFRAWGKHYPSANHFRLIDRDIEQIAERLAETALGGWVIPPQGPFAFVHGPTSETIETFDRSFLSRMVGAEGETSVGQTG